MKPATYNIEAVQGDDYALVITFTDVDGTPLDYSGFSFAAQTRPNFGSGASEDFTVDDSGAVDGMITIGLSAAQTKRMPANGVWDLQLIDTLDQITTFMRGKYVLQREVTRTGA